MDLPHIYSNISNELLFQHIQVPGLLLGVHSHVLLAPHSTMVHIT